MRCLNHRQRNLSIENSKIVLFVATTRYENVLTIASDGPELKIHELQNVLARPRSSRF